MQRRVMPSHSSVPVTRFTRVKARFSDPKRLSVILDVTELEISALKAGQKLKIQVRAYPDRVFEGKIEHIGAEFAAVDQAGQCRRRQAVWFGVRHSARVREAAGAAI